MNDHPPSDPCRDPFEQTLEALISGDASAHDHTILNDTLRFDPEARRIYIRTMAFEAMLAREFAAPEDAVAPPIPRKRWPTVLAVAATVMLAAILAWRVQPSPEIPKGTTDVLMEADTVITHAVITSLDNASGRFDGKALIQGLRLPEGMFELDQGYAEITFDTGAEVTLQGPARLQLESENRTRLASGRASTHIPEQARGFIIHTPTSYIRDFGTALAVEVRDDLETDLHVLEGEVEVAATGPGKHNPPKILRQRQAVRLAAGKMLPINFNPDNPGLRRKKRSQKAPSSVHWSFDSWDGKTTIASSHGHSLKLKKGKSPELPEVIDGMFGQALHFPGSGCYASSDYPGVAGSQARTVACWVRVQPDDNTAATPSVGIISWGVNRSADKWQIAWNRSQNQGASGAPRVDFGNGFAVGSTDLRDGRWHHLAVVYLGGPKANVATHVRIYVDGRLEPITGRRQREIDTADKSAKAKPLALGRNLGGKPVFFRGDLDEVHVFEGPLLPDQVNRLMKTNTARAAKKQPVGSR